LITPRCQPRLGARSAGSMHYDFAVVDPPASASGFVWPGQDRRDSEESSCRHTRRASGSGTKSRASIDHGSYECVRLAIFANAVKNSRARARQRRASSRLFFVQGRRP
jgi:hypothetical protein